MIKIEIHTLAGQLDIEIKRNENSYDLLVILSRSQYFHENGRVWNGKIIQTEKLSDIAGLIKACNKNPSVHTKKTINDGRLIQINLNNDEALIGLRLTDIDENTHESELIRKIKELTNEVTAYNADLEYYLNEFMD
ncbi:MAG: hypothetical protein LBE92_17140 [Chryseobacterium sp.]|jgi:hypothetical protein|uniref:hypothetical protein n=1 Tax=Chryseobacterium sp. TaxID=1871047 RepID=UPI0028294777|nr:hypothetical protein [Chryseobacterium sp.]MDR2237851.1 hypothetical protein [Chryseobacterium sp.]